MYETINSSFDFGGIQLKNRIIFAPTTMGLEKHEYYKIIKEIASGGCAMIIIGDVSVSKTKSSRSLYSKKGFDHYQKLAEIAHEYDCKICAQLFKSDANIKGMLKYIPGLLTKRISKKEIRELLNQEVGQYISTLPLKKIQAITDAFGDAAVMAVKAGFDLVQVHGDRMCGSFSSIVFNKRTDKYGGSTDKLAQFAFEAVTSIRQKMPELPIDYKLSVRQENPHYGNAGILIDDLAIFIPLLEKAGITSFHVTLANHSELSDTIPTTKHPYFFEEGCFLKFSDETRKYTKLPICGVGGLTSPDFVEEQLKIGRIDCVAMSRQIVADPQWVNKTASGQESSIKHCVRCNIKCLGGMQQHKGVHCIYDKEEN